MLNMQKTKGRPSKSFSKSSIVTGSISALLLAAVFFLIYVLYMPGSSLEYWDLPSEKLASESFIERKTRLTTHVSDLSEQIGERNYFVADSLTKTLAYLEGYLDSNGVKHTRHSFGESRSFSNLELVYPATIPGSGKTLVIGAHFDTAKGTAGANDNASGVALLLELARDLINFKERALELRLVFFTNEEPPFFQGPEMGSNVYAQKLQRDGVQVECMLSLETLGYYSDLDNSQRYPFPLSLFYPHRGNFIGVVGDLNSAAQARNIVGKLRALKVAPIQGGAFPRVLPGISWSDHWSFWQTGNCGIMLTDTAPFRYPYYHTNADRVDKLDFDRLTLLSMMLAEMVRDISQ